MRGIAHQHHLAGGVGLQRRQLVQVVVQHAAGLGRSQERRDRVVPAAEPADQPGQPVTRGAFRGVGRGIAVDPPVRERPVLKFASPRAKSLLWQLLAQADGTSGINGYG